MRPQVRKQVSLTASRGIDLRGITWEELCDVTWEAVTPPGNGDLGLRVIRQRKKRNHAGAPQVRKKDRLPRGREDRHKGRPEEKEESTNGKDSGKNEANKCGTGETALPLVISDRREEHPNTNGQCGPEGNPMAISAGTATESALRMDTPLVTDVLPIV